jgi:hypothetical protein
MELLLGVYEGSGEARSEENSGFVLRRRAELWRDVGFCGADVWQNGAWLCFVDMRSWRAVVIEWMGI